MFTERHPREDNGKVVMINFNFPFCLVNFKEHAMILAMSRTWSQVHFSPLSKNNDYSAIPDRVCINKISLEREDKWL